MAEKKQEPLDMETAAEILTKHVAAMEARNQALIERVMATASGPPTLRERRASSRAKLANYHDEVRAGKRERHRATTRTDAEDAARAAAEAPDDAA